MAKPKVIVQLYPMLPTKDRAEREEKGLLPVIKIFIIMSYMNGLI